MSQFSKELKTYADNGLRTAADWLVIGREVESGSTPRTIVRFSSKDIELFTRDQTQRRQSRRHA